METRKPNKKPPLPKTKGLIIYYSLSGGSVDIEDLKGKDTKGVDYVCTSGEPLQEKDEAEIVGDALINHIAKRLQL